MLAAQQGQTIAIAGAGPVGLFTAILLVNAGFRVTVFEKNDGPVRDMRASTFHPATLDLLGPLGLAAPLISRGTISQGWQYWVHGTRQHVVFDLIGISDLTLHPFRLQCEQFHFSTIALEELSRSPLFEVRFGHEMVGVENRGMEARMRIRGPEGEYGFHSPWLIAADGGRSAVRRQLGLDFAGSEFPRTSITLVLNFPFQQHISGLMGINYVWTDTGHYSLMQIRDSWRFSYTPDQDQAVDEALSEPVAQSHIQAVFPSEQSYDILHRNHYTLHQRCLDSFRHGRILFVGDAAHLNSPSGGMGMNSGIHDAQCLVDHLVRVLRGENQSLLDRYSRRRRTIALEEVQRLSARNYHWHRETDQRKREEIWKELRGIADDRGKTRDFLLSNSMIRSRQRELEID